MVNTNTGPAKHIELYRGSWISLQEKAPQLREYNNNGIHATWMISYEFIRTTNPLATNLLKLWACFNITDLCYELLTNSASLQPAWFRDVVKSEIEFNDAVETLSRYSLVESDSKPDGFSMHAVVHEWYFYLSQEDNGSELVQIAITTLGSPLKTYVSFENWPFQRRLTPYASGVMHRIRYSLPRFHIAHRRTH